MCVYVINIYHIYKLSRTVFYFEKTLLYEIAIIRTIYIKSVVELEISVITFELVHAIHVSQNVAVKDCTLYMNAHL